MMLMQDHMLQNAQVLHHTPYYHDLVQLNYHLFSSPSRHIDSTDSLDTLHPSQPTIFLGKSSRQHPVFGQS